jgi:hypothetical protein
MKKQLLLMATLGVVNYAAQAQTTDTVSTGTGYATQKWYSLQNDEQGAGQAKDNWDIGFEISGQSASIIGNTQKANVAIYKTPYAVADWNNIDSSQMTSWEVLHNSDTTWTRGAFNTSINPNNSFDLGWGIYDLNTHYVNGDSCFVIRIGASTYKKLRIDALANGIYSFTYANIDGTNTQTGTIDKSTYAGKNFGYYNLSTNTALDREPASATWDFTFTKYITFLPTPYGVTGLLSNKGVTVAQANGIANVATYNNYSAHTFTKQINEIGYDWKYFNGSAFVIEDSLVYFVKDKTAEIWSVVFTGFGGSANGKYIFTKRKLSTTALTDLAGNTLSQFTIYPNPSTDGVVNVLFSSEKNIDNATLTILDITGKVVLSNTISLAEGFNTYSTGLNELNSGVYFIQLKADNVHATQKFIKQ